MQVVWEKVVWEGGLGEGGGLGGEGGERWEREVRGGLGRRRRRRRGVVWWEKEGRRESWEGGFWRRKGGTDTPTHRRINGLGGKGGEEGREWLLFWEGWFGRGREEEEE